jgi:hypothetical protein
VSQNNRSVTNVEVVVLALARLNGATRKVHTEHIAEEAHRLAPDRFSWRLEEYRERGWPDKEVVRSGLEDAAKEKNGVLVEGAHATDLSKDGWGLTVAGVEWLKTHADRVASLLDLPKAAIPKRDALRFVKQIRSQPLFKRHDTGGISEGNRYEFTDMLNCSPDAPHDVIRAKFERMKAMAQQAGDKDVLKFLEDCGAQFSKVLKSSQP